MFPACFQEQRTGHPIYLVNDYSKEEEPQADVSAFEEWEYINE